MKTEEFDAQFKRFAQNYGVSIKVLSSIKEIQTLREKTPNLKNSYDYVRKFSFEKKEERKGKL